MKDPRAMDSIELKVWLGQHLQNGEDAGTNLAIRREEAPYEEPALLWKSESGNYRKNLPLAVNDLLNEAVSKPWTPIAFNELMRLVEATRLKEVENSIERIVRKRMFLTADMGMQLHMQALRTLLALGWNGTLNFWFVQEKLLKNQWPALIFKGLSRHGLDVAFAHLPSLAVNKTAMQNILNLFPRIMEIESGGIAKLWERINVAKSELSAETAALAIEWFRLQNYPPLKSYVNPRYNSLLTAVRGIIGDINPKPLAAALGGKINHQNYAYATV